MAPVFVFFTVQDGELDDFAVFDSQAKAEVNQLAWMKGVAGRWGELLPADENEAADYIMEAGYDYWIEPGEVR